MKAQSEPVIRSRVPVSNSTSIMPAGVAETRSFVAIATDAN
jgi:hypothetical protein